MFSLITGYSDPPAGIELKGNLHYNKYFPGGAIAMARSLYDDLVEYEDGKTGPTHTCHMHLGTPSPSSQMAKDVTTFLGWAAEPEHDDRKLMGAKAMGIGATLAVFMYYIYRHRWSYLRNARLVYRRPAPPKTHDN